MVQRTEIAFSLPDCNRLAKQTTTWVNSLTPDTQRAAAVSQSRLADGCLTLGGVLAPSHLVTHYYICNTNWGCLGHGDGCHLGWGLGWGWAELAEVWVG